MNNKIAFLKKTQTLLLIIIASICLTPHTTKTIETGTFEKCTFKTVALTVSAITSPLLAGTIAFAANNYNVNIVMGLLGGTSALGFGITAWNSVDPDDESQNSNEEYFQI